MSDFDNYFGYRDAIKYGGMVIQDTEQPINTVEGANEAIKNAVSGDLEPGYLQQPPRPQEEIDERNRRMKIAATMPVDMAAGAARGVAEGWAGLPGDLISLYRALYNMGAVGAGESKLDAFLHRALYNMGVVGAGESKLDAFLQGLDLATGLPTTQDIQNFLDENIGPIVPATAAEGTREARESAVSGAQLVGELLAPAGYISLAKRGVKAARARRAKKNDGAQ